MSLPPSNPPGSTHSSAEETAPQLCANAVALREQGALPQAIAIFDRALALDPTYAEGWLELGNAHMHAVQLPEASAAYERAIALEAALSEAHANLALAYQEQGRPEDAITAYRAALAIDPTDSEVLMDIGLLLQEQEHWKEAFEAFEQAQAIVPSSALLARMADLLMRLEDREGAVHHYRQALSGLAATEHTDLQPQILARLGVALHQLGQLEEAIATYGQALNLQPGWLEIHAHRNAALAQLKGGLSHVRQTLQLLAAEDGAATDDAGWDVGDGKRAERIAQLGAALHRAGCLQEAIDAYGQALALQPDLEAVAALRSKALEQSQDPHLLGEIAGRFNQLAMFEDQLKALEQAAALAPNDPNIQLDRGLALLRLGRLEEGWPLYALRGTSFSAAIALPPWQPERACDRLLILPPKDLGDQIMFASLLSEAGALAPEQAVVVDPRLQTLIARSFPHLPVLAPGQPLNTVEFQAQIWMGSMAAPLRPTKDHFLAHRKAYLLADPAKTQALRRRHHPSQGGEAGSQARGQGASRELLVGLCWRSTSPANGVMKSIPLETLAGALAIPGVRLLSLQYGDTRGERDALRRATGLEVVADPEIDTFHDIDNLAALIAACDVVVSVSNTTAHLAGALGQPTWLLIDSRLDWRWGLTDSDTLWYPNARLFRQSAAGDWDTPLREIQAELRALREQGGWGPAVPWQGGGLQGPGGQTLQSADKSSRPGAAQPPGKWVF